MILGFTISIPRGVQSAKIVLVLPTQLIVDAEFEFVMDSENELVIG